MMRNVFLVASDILREATSRRWLAGMWALITLLAAAAAFTLQMQVVDGVLAGTRLFGGALDHDLRSVDLALRPVYEAGSMIMFIGGVMFGMFSCSDFAPELLMPGRIEQLLALPLRRAELILGTYVGVLAIAVLGSLYAGGLFTLLFGLKSGVWSSALLVSGLAACAAFASLYGAMLASATFVRSAALSTGVGGVLFVLASTLTRPGSADVLEAGIRREIFLFLTSWLPRFSVMGHLGSAAAGAEPFTPQMFRAVLSSLVFGAGCVAIAIWKSERTDY